MDDWVERKAVKEWLARWIGYIDEDIIARMQFRVIDIPSTEPEARTPTWKEEDRFVKGYFTWYPYCPKCDHEVVTGQCYCEICGQHIDWSEDDE